MRFIGRLRRAAATPRRRAFLAVLVSLIVLCVAPLLAADGAYRGRLLIDVLAELRDRGLNLIYSSAVVGNGVRVLREPGARDPVALLDEILRPHGLEAREGPRGAILVVPREQIGAVNGKVLSVAGGAPVAGAVIDLVDTDFRAVADDSGSFEIGGIPAGTYALRVVAAGFSDAGIARLRVGPDRPVELRVELKARPNFITEVVVTPNRHSLVQQEQTTRRTLSAEDVVLAPAIGSDVTRVVELVPGVAAADNSAVFSVRGSVPRDVSLMLDGLELYDPYHLRSFHSPFSVIDSNIVDRIDFFGGGYTADLGDRHGGFVDFTTDAPVARGTGQLELGNLNGRIGYQGQLAKGRGAWLLNARAWYPEALWTTTELGAGEQLDPRFSDFYGKLDYRVARRHVFSAHALLAHDDLQYQEQGEEINEVIDAKTKNGNVWFRLRSAWSDGFSSQAVVSGGRIDRVRNGTASETGELGVRDERVVDFVGFRFNSAWEVSPAHVLKAGVEVRHLDAQYRYTNTLPDDPDALRDFRADPAGTSSAVYAAWRARVGKHVATELGLRWDRQTYTNDNQLGPRFNAVWRPDDRSELRVAVGRFSQSQRIHELQVEDGETEFQMAELSDQAEMSFQYSFAPWLSLRVDAYTRRLDNLRARYENLFEPIELFPEVNPDRVRIAPDEARLRGVELLLRGDSSRRWTWWVSYVRSSAEDRVDGRWVPRSWDQPHAARALVGYRGGDRWLVSLTGSVHTGWPTTPVTAEVVAEGRQTEIDFVPGERNSARFPTYARLDLKVRRWIPLAQGNGGRLALTLEIINLTDRDNSCCIDEFVAVPRPGGDLGVVTKYDHWLGFTPTFSALWQF